MGLWQLDGKLIGSRAGVLVHGHRCDPPAKGLQWVSDDHEVAFPFLLPWQVLDIRAHCQMIQEGNFPGHSKPAWDKETWGASAYETHQNLL